MDWGARGCAGFTECDTAGALVSAMPTLHADSQRLLRGEPHRCLEKQGLAHCLRAVHPPYRLSTSLARNLRWCSSRRTTTRVPGWSPSAHGLAPAIRGQLTPVHFQAYMKEAHGDWLSLPMDSPLRDELKRKCV